jgi:hypothetical protein
MVTLQDTLGGARARIFLKPGTVVDNPPMQIDNGYQAEMVVDLTKLGYPTGLGERRLHWGITLFDGDQFSTAADSYGNRTWWFREYDNTSGPVWAHLSSTVFVDVPGETPAPSRLALLGNHPNPFRFGTTVRFALPRAAEVELEVFDLMGRRVSRISGGKMEAGPQQIGVVASDWRAGVYLYRLRVLDPDDGAEMATFNGRMLHVN